MLCQNCGSNEANVKYTQIVNGIKKEMSLCDRCSKEIGIGGLDFNMPINFNSFLGEFLNEYNDTDLLTNLTSPKQLKCNKCNMSYDEFIETGKLGCAECYTSFKGKLNSVLKKLHGSNIHTGKKLNNERIGHIEQHDEPADSFPQSTDEVDQRQELLDLKTKLRQCIKEEKYEEAAEVRDTIKKLEEGGNINE